MEAAPKVLYVYRCSACGHRGEIHLDGDAHDGKAGSCASCNAAVVLEWDGGVTFETRPRQCMDDVPAPMPRVLPTMGV